MAGTVSIGTLQEHIANYKQQMATANAQLQHLDQQKEITTVTIRMLAGAIAAIEQLVENIQKADTESAVAVSQAQNEIEQKLGIRNPVDSADTSEVPIR